MLIIDGSAAARQLMSQMLSKEPGMEVMGAASDPRFALAKMACAWPDVIVLNIDMPRMDDLSFLRKLMLERPTPVVICSPLAQGGVADILARLPKGMDAFLRESGGDLAAAIHCAAVSMADRPRLFGGIQQFD
ncbi:response regulator [Chromobacterium alticapitis]|uniref:response regulator n=1 Tax=Chromobacterium alticapitis TaxID=2073169 RepID=UPI001304BC8D|nr:response regulator [Chromobacterium alticapitis]